MKYNNLRSLYISELESHLQTKIKNHLIDFLKEDLELNKVDLNIELELAMSSRVNDLEDTILFILLLYSKNSTHFKFIY